MTDLASGPAVGVPVRARAVKRKRFRVALILGLAVAALAVVGYFTRSSTSHPSVAAGQISLDAKATYSAQSVSCHQVDRIPALTSSAIFACTISGVARSNRPVNHPADATFTRCYIRTVGDQTVDVSLPVSVLAQRRHKTAPCS